MIASERRVTLLQFDTQRAPDSSTSPAGGRSADRYEQERVRRAIRRADPRRGLSPIAICQPINVRGGGAEYRSSGTPPRHLNDPAYCTPRRRLTVSLVAW